MIIHVDQVDPVLTWRNFVGEYRTIRVTDYSVGSNVGDKNKVTARGKFESHLRS